MSDPIRAASAGLKRSKCGVNKNSEKTGLTYVTMLDGILYIERRQTQRFRNELKSLCDRFDYKFVPADQFD